MRCIRTGIVFVCVLAALAGCFESERPPDIFLVERVEWSYSEPLVFANVTFKNAANISLANPNLRVILHEIPREFGTRYNFSVVSLSLWQQDANEPRREVYYPDDVKPYFGGAPSPSIVSPIEVPANASLRFTFAFLPKQTFTGDVGHYMLDAWTEAGLAGWSVGEEYNGPCFNLDTPSYYGKNERAGECYNRAPRDPPDHDNDFRLQKALEGALTGIDVAYWNEK